MPSDERERQSGKPTGDGEPQAESGKLKHPGAGVITRLTARQHVWLLLVFVLALGFRGAYLWSQASNNPLFDYPQMDGRVHHEWAQQIASGEGMEKRPYLRAPLYYHLLGLLYSIVGPKVAVARIVGILVGSLSCYLIARLGASLGGFRVGLLAGVLAALYWPMVYFDAELLTVGVEVFLNVAMLLALLSAGKRGGWWRFGGAGLLWGLSAIARPNVLAIAPVIWLWTWITSAPKGQTARRAIAVGAVTAGLLVVVLSVTLRNRAVGGEWTLIASSGGINFFIGNNADSTGYLAEVPGAPAAWDEWLHYIEETPEEELGRELSDGEVSSYWFGQARSWIRSDPGAWVAHTWNKLRLFWSPIEVPNNQPIWFLAKQSSVSYLFWIGFPLIVCLAGGGLVAIREPEWRMWLLPLAFAAVYMLTVVAFFCPARFRIPIVPILIVLAALGVMRLVEWCRARRTPAIVGYAALAIAAAGFLWTSPPARAEFARTAEAEGHFMLGRHFATPAPNGPGDFKQAAESYRKAVEVDPKPHYRSALARVLLYELDELEEGARQFRLLIDDQPENVSARRDYALFLIKQHDLPGAANQLHGALNYASDDAELVGLLNDVECEIATRMMAAGNVQPVVSLLTSVLERDETHAQAWQTLGVAHARMRAMEEAVNAFRQSLKHNPMLTESAANLARALQALRRHGEAAKVLDEALMSSPGDVNILTSLALLLATAPQDDLRDGERAVRLAEQATLLSEKSNIAMLDALAAAYAEAGRFEDAVRVAEQALEMAKTGRSEYWVRKMEALLPLYRQQRPYHEPMR